MGKFSKGDKIIAIEEAKGSKCRIINKGEILTVYDMGPGGEYIWFSDTGHNKGSYRASSFELYKEKNMSEFKVGDEVIITNNDYRGNEGTIVHTDGYSFLVQRKDTSFLYGFEERRGYKNSRWFDMGNLILNKTNNMSKKLTGYKLKKAIPGDSRKVETIVNTVKTDYYELLPEFWEPQYAPNEEYKEGDYIYMERNDGGAYRGSHNFGSAKVGEYYRVNTNYGQNGFSSKEDYVNVNIPGVGNSYDIPKEWVRKATEREIYRLTIVQVGSYRAEFSKGKVVFGCQTFALAEVETVNRILGLEGKININGMEITKEIVHRVLDNIK